MLSSIWKSFRRRQMRTYFSALKSQFPPSNTLLNTMFTFLLTCQKQKKKKTTMTWNHSQKSWMNSTHIGWKHSGSNSIFCYLLWWFWKALKMDYWNIGNKKSIRIIRWKLISVSFSLDRWLRANLFRECLKPVIDCNHLRFAYLVDPNFNFNCWIEKWGMWWAFLIPKTLIRICIKAQVWIALQQVPQIFFWIRKSKLYVITPSETFKKLIEIAKF